MDLEFRYSKSPSLPRWANLWNESEKPLNRKNGAEASINLQEYGLGVENDSGRKSKSKEVAMVGSFKKQRELALLTRNLTSSLSYIYLFW